MCKRCQGSCSSSISGKRKRMKKVSTSKLIMSGAGAAGGYAASRFLGKIPFVQQNQIVKAAAPFVAAYLTSAFLGKKGADLATGMVVGGVVETVSSFAPGVANTLNLPPSVGGYRLNVPQVGRLGATPKVAGSATIQYN